MVGTALFEVCGGIVTGLTRGVAEHFINTNEESLCLSESPLVYNPLESTGLEWNHRPVDECIYEEYKDREVTISRHFTWRKVQPKVLNALLPDDGEVTTEQTNDKRTTWKLFRPSLKGTLPEIPLLWIFDFFLKCIHNWIDLYPRLLHKLPHCFSLSDPAQSDGCPHQSPMV